MNPNIRPLDGPPIPLMVDGILSAEQLRQLFADLKVHTAGLDIRDRAGKTFTPEAARDRLLNGQLAAIQVRYHYDGFDWTDTLMRTPQGIRAVRCRHEPMPG